MIALAHGYGPLVLGRILQGISGGLIGVVIPLYLAECLSAANRGKGTGVFQWLLTLGIVAAALIGLYFSHRVDEVAKLGDAAKLFAFKDTRLARHFLGFAATGNFIRHRQLPGGRIAALAVSARQKGRRARRAAAFAHGGTGGNRIEGNGGNHRRRKEQDFSHRRKNPGIAVAPQIRDSVFAGLRHSRLQPGHRRQFRHRLQRHHSHSSRTRATNRLILAIVLFTIVNFVATIIAVVLVDRKGRKFLLSVGTGGVIVSMICVGLLFHKTEKLRVDCKDAIQAMVTTNQTLTLAFNEETAANFLAGKMSGQQPTTLVIIYSCGDFHGVTTALRSDDAAAKPIEISRNDVCPQRSWSAFLEHPFANYNAATNAPLKIDAALITPVPDARNGWLTAILLYIYMAFFAVGPGVCVWLALSELMPTRIRSNGMSIALVINQFVSWTIAAVFLPTVGKYGYSTMFFAVCRLHRHLFHHRHVLSAGDQGQDPGGNRGTFRRTEKALTAI